MRWPVVALLLCVAACARDPLNVTTIQVGRSLNSDNSIGSHATSFKPTDTIYAAVLTDRPGAGTIAARWSLGGRIIDETSKEVSYNDASATEFHLRYPGGLPVGDYTLEVLLDGKSVGTRQMRVAR